ncbi:XkdX family protein [Bacillus changyiensis]|uniref:XkdX family protein n=1 Tax=Bacillus changyiensis TaxID=3004103 RepID=UPI0022E7C210|nr:XkdX family protein [Bacillus changyiensis]
MHVLYYDASFKYAGEDDVEINGDTLPPNSTTVLIPEGIYVPKYQLEKGVWVETATQEYIDSVKPSPPEPSETEILRKQVAHLYYMISIEGSEKTADWFTYMKGFYKNGLWTKKQIHDGVGAGRITPKQYEEITGEPYDPNKPPSDKTE